MPSLGPAEILVILVVALLVFGPDKMPDIAKQVGKGFREFRRVQQHLKSELRDVVSEFDSPSSSPAVEQQAVPMLPPTEDTATIADDPAPAVDAGVDPAVDAVPAAPVLPTFPEPPPAVAPPALPTPPAATTPAVDVTLPSADPDAPSAPA